VCDRPLGKDGECFLFPNHSQEHHPDLRVVEDETNHQAEVEGMDDTAVTIESGGESVTTTVGKLEEAVGSMSGVITGGFMSEGDGDYQYGQLSLSAELFDRYAVEAVKVSIGGTIEIPLEALEQMTAGLEPGDAVAFSCRGHVADVSTPYRVKDRSHDGRLVLKVEVLHGVEVLRVPEVDA
jgi:hypothetical protein